MTATTAPTLLRGVDQHRDRYRVRMMFPAPFGRIVQLYDTADEANAAALDLNRRRKAGLPPTDRHADPTLAEAAAELLARKQIGGRRGKLRANGLKHWRLALRPWMEGEHAHVPLSLLRRARLEDAVLARAAQYPTTAKNELEALKAVLRYAGARGASFDLGILTIQPVAVERRKRRALTADELEFLADHAPAYAQRLILFLGTTGMRCGEAFTLTDDRLDLTAGTAHVPAELCKEGVAKTIPLTGEERQLVREQLLARAPGTPLVFPKAGGGQWSTARSHFHKLVWTKTCTRAAEAWRELHGPGVTPFDGLVPHDLRSTAATLMRDAGLARDMAAARLGHADGGRLLDDVYDQGDKAARVAHALAAAAPHGIRRKLSEPATRGAATRPALTAGSVPTEVM